MSKFCRWLKVSVFLENQSCVGSFNLAWSEENFPRHVTIDLEDLEPSTTISEISLQETTDMISQMNSNGD
jgi:hypothetical protein